MIRCVMAIFEADGWRFAAGPFRPAIRGYIRRRATGSASCVGPGVFATGFIMPPCSMIAARGRA